MSDQQNINASGLQRWLGQYRISHKILLPTLIQALLLMLLCGLAVNALYQFSTIVVGITKNLAPDADKVTDIRREMQLMRIKHKEYAQNSSPEVLGQFKGFEQDFETAFQIADDAIEAPERRALLAKLRGWKDEYATLFYEQVVVESERAMNNRVAVMDVLGPKIVEDAKALSKTSALSYYPQTSYIVNLIQVNMFEARMSAFKFLIDNETQHIDTATANLDALTLNIKEILNSVSAAELQELDRQILEYRTALLDVVAATRTKNTALKQMDELGRQLGMASSQLADSVFEDLQVQGAKTEEKISDTIMEIITLSVLMLLIGVGLSFFITRLIVNPIDDTSNMLRSVAKGEGDLTQRLPIFSDDEIGKMATNFNQFIQSVHGIICQTASSTSQLATAAEQLSVMATQTREGVKSQKHSMDEAKGYNEGVLQGVANISSAANSTGDLADKTNEVAQSIKTSVSESVSNITRLAEDLESSKQVFGQLREDSNRIGDVLALITGITDQINLLALNAAIEAARAGEAGRGFAVVADEVRTLAKRTQESTDEIESSINSLIQANDNAMSLIERNQSMARSTSDEANKMAVELNQVTDQIHSVSAAIKEIYGFAQDQQAYANELGIRFNTVSSALVETDEAAKQSEQSSAGLAKLGSELDELVGNFKV